MYKVFFNDRLIILTEETNQSELLKTGRLVRYTGKDLLTREIHEFSALEKEKSLIIVGENPDKILGDLSGLFKTIEAAGGLVRNKEGEVLLIYRFGKWDLPKGKMNRGEKPGAAALREITEECGINGQKLLRKLTNTYHTYNEKDTNFLKKIEWFEFLYEGAEIPVPQTKEGITEAVWMKPGKLETVYSNTWASLLDVFAAAGLTTTPGWPA